MSRLPAPGFSSRLRAPGFTNKPTSVTAATEVPLPPDENIEENETFVKAKGPDAPKPRGIPSTAGLRPPKPSTRVAKGQASSSNLHGPSPYDRSRPQNNSIPYVGKKRATGTLKAPEGRSSANTTKTNTSLSTSRNTSASRNNTTITKSEDLPNTSKNQSTKKEATQPTMGNAIAKPVKRQLIPPGATNKSKLVQPRSAIARPQSSTGSHPPKTKGSSMANKKTISRSLQSLPQPNSTTANTSRSKLTKSSSTDALSNISKNTAVKSRSNIGKPANALKPPAPTSRFSKPGLIRPRHSSHKPKTEMSISTPCQTGGKHLNTLKISPIINNNDFTQDASVLDNSGLPHEPANLSQSVLGSDISYTGASISKDDNINELPKEDMTAAKSLNFNATFNKIDIPSDSNKTQTVVKDDANTTTVVLKQEENNNVIGDLNQTHVIGAANLTQTIPTNDQMNSTVNLTKPIDKLDQTHVINTSISPPLNATRVIDNEQEKSVDWDETDFLEHQAMPHFEETPQKGDKTLDESQENNSSFTDDILKVIAAISSQVNTLPEPSVVMAMSPMKMSGDFTEHVLHHEVIQQSNNTVTVTSTSNKSYLVSDASTVKNEDDTLDSSALKELELDTTSKPKSNSVVEYPNSPTTPKNEGDEEGDNFFNISNRCYTVSAAELRRPKVTRRNTFQAHDATKFRAPKDMNVLETLEGNILMDNTSFLQLSNDTRSIKTMLLKLKRTLLEADCPSPLVKAPLKRSNSCAVRRTGDPPLSPRISLSSPMAVVDPFPPSNDETTSTSPKENKEETFTFDKTKSEETPTEKADSMANLTGKFQESLRRIEELEKEQECNKYTIKLLQTQLETTEQKEQDMLEENIILREEVNHLTERIQKLTAKLGNRERNLSSSGSYKEEFDLADTESRRGILERIYSYDSFEANNE
uniref:Uncharacterized protein n=2 Tax=Clytia hemisphaerica TaxID=252671 RepID=A0A7M5WWZ9_9CNID